MCWMPWLISRSEVWIVKSCMNHSVHAWRSCKRSRIPMYLIYQAAYAAQALMYVPDNETPWQGALRRTGKVLQGTAELVSATKGLDLKKFIDGLEKIQKGVSGLSKAIKLTKDVYSCVNSLSSSGRNFLGCLKESLSLQRKRAWYPTLQQTTQPSGVVESVETLFQTLESNGDFKKQALLQACRKEGVSRHPLTIALPRPTYSSLLCHAQNRPEVENGLNRLGEQRRKERGNILYIQPQAKVSLQTSDIECFPLMERVKTFLNSDEKEYQESSRIPLHISLPAIDKPEYDMISKQLRKAGFTEPQIRELKPHHKFVIICDGYDESQQTHNLYTSNRLNQPGQWRVHMVISCRSEYLGVDYRDRFQPADRNRQTEPAEQVGFQEAILTPFSEGQIKEYINQFVHAHVQLWKGKEYQEALDRIPGLKELVKISDCHKQLEYDGSVVEAEPSASNPSLNNHSKRVSSAVFSPQGDTIVTGSEGIRFSTHSNREEWRQQSPLQGQCNDVWNDLKELFSSNTQPLAPKPQVGLYSNNSSISSTLSARGVEKMNEQNFRAFQDEAWTLSSGACFDDIVAQYVRSLKKESSLHSSIITNAMCLHSALVFVKFGQSHSVIIGKGPSPSTVAIVLDFAWLTKGCHIEGTSVVDADRIDENGLITATMLALKVIQKLQQYVACRQWGGR
ncbi:MAG: hypothetical protein J3Q66DRAFT_422449 [Benniella sp.]|nr:MAG: hypothetical protein J3Q66DRAFT_422449 [Benniella sp.]